MHHSNRPAIRAIRPLSIFAMAALVATGVVSVVLAPQATALTSVVQDVSTNATNCSSVVSYAAPANTVTATINLSGGGGAGGGTHSGHTGGSGGAGSKITGTFSITSGSIYVRLGCGGSPGSASGSCGASRTGGAGGLGYVDGAKGGDASLSSNCSGVASGGGGGGSSAICLVSNCTTSFAVAGGGGGGGGSAGGIGSNSGGTGGAGANSTTAGNSGSGGCSPGAGDSGSTSISAGGNGSTGGFNGSSAAGGGGGGGGTSTGKGGVGGGGCAGTGQFAGGGAGGGAATLPTGLSATTGGSGGGGAQTSGTIGSVTITWNVKTTQTISFTSTAPAGAVVGGATYTATATATSGLGVAFSLDPTSTGCTIAGAVVSFTAVGTCKVNANQAGNGDFAAAAQVQQSFAVGKGNQSVTFTSSNPSPVSLPSGTYTVTATATSGLPVSYALDLASSGCSIAGNVVTFTGQGSCLVNASQGGNANWNAATTVTQVITVNRSNQTVSFTSTNPSPVTLPSGTYAVSATASSGLTVAFSLDGSSTGCSLAGSTVTFTGAGTCRVNANQAGNSNWNAAAQVQQVIAIGRGSQSINFTSSAPSPGFVGGPAYTVSASASSGLAVAFTLDGSSTGCSLSGSSVTFTGAGTCRVNANQAGDSNWNAAAQVQQSFAVVVPRATSTVLSCVNPTLAYDSTASCTVTVSDVSGSPVTPSSAVALSASGSPGTATFSSCALAQVSVGVASCVVTFTVTEQDSYLVSASAVVNAVHGASSSNVVSVKFGPHATSTVVSCSPSSLVAGSPSSCTATVTDTQVGVTKTSPTGTVVFGQSGGGSFSSTTCVLSAGVSPVSSCSVSFTPTFGGAKTVTASFDGFSSGAVAGGFRHRSSSAVPVPLTVSGSSAQHPTSTSVSCSPNPVQVSTATTCTAIVTDTMTFAATATPTGTVNFAYSGGGALSPTSCTLAVNVAGSSAKCSVTFTPNGIAGSKTVQANYAGVPVLFKASGSGSVFVTATAAPVTPPTPQVQHPTSTSVSCSPSTLPLGNASTCTVTVTDTYDGTTSSPAGTVSVGSSGGGTLSAPTCTLQPSGNGATSTCQVTFTPTGAKGSKTVIASYAGTPEVHKASGSGTFYLTAT